jgi:hypothetical protein
MRTLVFITSNAKTIKGAWMARLNSGFGAGFHAGNSRRAESVMYLPIPAGDPTAPQCAEPRLIRRSGQ